jgi:CRISPR type III-A-associated RAMP protein Csm4
MASVQTASAARPGLLVKLRPSRPWRSGPASGARDSVDLTYHSDTLYAALTHAMRLLGKLEFWLESTARAGEGGSPIRFTSLFPFFGDTLYVPPPRHIWPPAPSVRVRYSGARFVPASLVESIFAGHPLQDDRWSVDGVSECLIPSGRSGPFRVSVRYSAAVDRITGASAPHHTACIEFAPKSGLWFAVSFADAYTRDQWSDSLRAAIRLLADSGFGGERSRGWGRAHSPEFRDGVLPQLIYKGLPSVETVSWSLSLISPAEADQVDWEKGSYSATVRGGRIDSPAAGSGAAKKLLTMIEEGSVLSATKLEGNAPDVAPDGFAHPVYHAGWAFVIAVPAEVPRQLDVVAAPPVETPTVEEAEEAEEVAADTVPPSLPLEEPADPLPDPVDPQPDPDPLMAGPVSASPDPLPAPLPVDDPVDEPGEPSLPPNDPDPALPSVEEPEPESPMEGPIE